MQEKNRHRELAAVLGAFGIVAVGLAVHVPGVGPEEAVMLQRRGVSLEILFGDHVAVARHVGAGPAAEPAAGLAHAGGRRRLADFRRIALAEQHLHEVADVRLEVGLRLVEALLVEQVIIPLTDGVEIFGVDRAVDQRQPLVDRRAAGEIGHAEARHANCPVGMVGGDVPDHGAAPVMADPYGLVAAERREQLHHVGHDLFLGEVLVARVGAGSAIAAHVGRDTAEAERREGRQLVPPGAGQFRPAMDEDQQRCVFRSAGEIARRMSSGLDGVFGDRECHRQSCKRRQRVPWKSIPAQPNFCAACATAWR